MFHPSRRYVLMGLLATAAAPDFLNTAEAKEPHRPYVPGARWDYQIRAPLLGDAGKVTRTIEGDGAMKVVVDGTVSGSRNGTWLYRWEVVEGILRVKEARFTPKGNGQGWKYTVDPGLPLFPTAAAHRALDQVTTLALMDGTSRRTAQARIRTVSLRAEANGYGKLHQVEIEGDGTDPFPERAELWVSNEVGVVRSKIQISSVITVTWELRSYVPG